MFTFNEYVVEIKDREFKSPEGIIFPNSAIVTFRNREKKKSLVKKYGFFDTEIVYKKIENGEDINLNHAYVHNFSISKYRKSRGLAEEEMVLINNFTACDSIFDSLDSVDFSFCDFGDCDISFENAIFAQGEIFFHGAKFGKGNKDFTYLIVKNGNMNFSNADFGDGNIDFKNSIFESGNKDFQYTTFGNGDISFINTDFGDGDVSFINCNFGNGDCSFKVSRFGNGKVDFHYAKFGKGDISFERTEFGNGKVDFRTVEFLRAKLNFNRSVFGDCDLDFEACELKNGRFNFKSACLGKGFKNFSLCDFEGTNLTFDHSKLGEGDISFYNAKLTGLSMKDCHLDFHLDLRVSKCNYVDLSNTIVRDIIDLRPYEFKVDIDTINFTGMRLLGRIYVDWEDNKVQKLIESQTDTSEKIKGEQFRILKQNFNSTGQYTDEDTAYVEFKRFEARSQLHESVKSNPFMAIIEYPAYLFKWLVFDKMGLYATNPVRVLVSMAVCYVIFSCLYIIGDLLNLGAIHDSTPDIQYIFDNYGQHVSRIGLVAKSFYLSVIVFFTIGFGDFYPVGYLRIISGLEGFTGVFLMSYFTVAFVRKILR